MELTESEWLLTAEFCQVVYVHIYAQHFCLDLTQFLDLQQLSLNAALCVSQDFILHDRQHRTQDQQKCCDYPQVHDVLILGLLGQDQ